MALRVAPPLAGRAGISGQERGQGAEPEELRPAGECGVPGSAARAAGAEGGRRQGQRSAALCSRAALSRFGDDRPRTARRI